MPLTLRDGFMVAPRGIPAEIWYHADRYVVGEVGDYHNHLTLWLGDEEVIRFNAEGWTSVRPGLEPNPLGPGGPA